MKNQLKQTQNNIMDIPCFNKRKRVILSNVMHKRLKDVKERTMSNIRPVIKRSIVKQTKTKHKEKDI